VGVEKGVGKEISPPAASAAVARVLLATEYHYVVASNLGSLPLAEEADQALDVLGSRKEDGGGTVCKLIPTLDGRWTESVLLPSLYHREFLPYTAPIFAMPRAITGPDTGISAIPLVATAMVEWLPPWGSDSCRFPEDA
jgi:hypothetical protein